MIFDCFGINIHSITYRTILNFSPSPLPLFPFTFSFFAVYNYPTCIILCLTSICMRIHKKTFTVSANSQSHSHIHKEHKDLAQLYTLTIAVLLTPFCFIVAYNMLLYVVSNLIIMVTTHSLAFVRV